MKKKIILAQLILCLTIFLAGCQSQYPDLTEEQEDEVGEYAAFTLLKYDANFRSRLVSREDVEAENQKLIARALRKQNEKNNKEESEDKQQETVEEAEEIKINEENAEPEITLNELLNLTDGINAEYEGIEICKAYADKNNEGFSIEADGTDQLLVAKFKLSSSLEEEQNIDIFHQNLSAIITLKSGDKIGALTTMLTDDFATFNDKIEPQSSQELVLVFETKDSELTNEGILSLELKIGQNKYTISEK